MVEQPGEPLFIEEEEKGKKIEDSSAFNEAPEVEELSEIQKHPHFYDLSEEMQEQVLNLWKMGIVTDADKIMKLLSEHKNNIALVANDLFNSHI